MATEWFKINVPDWREIDIDNAKLILQEGKDHLKYLSDGSDKITNRAFAILVILVPITSALTAFVINQLLKPVWNDKFIQSLLIFVVAALIIIMFFLGRIVFPRLFMPAGTEPKDICTPDFLGLNFDPEKARLALILGQIESCQAKINFNDNQVNQRTKQLERLMLCIGLLFVLVMVCICGHLLLR